MSATTYTKGPWAVNDRFDIIAEMPGGWTPIVCTLVEGRFCLTPSVALHKDTLRANALLICAAPDLLEACKSAFELLGYCHEGTVQAKIADELKSAIAKAGGQPCER